MAGALESYGSGLGDAMGPLLPTTIDPSRMTWENNNIARQTREPADVKKHERLVQTRKNHEIEEGDSGWCGERSLAEFGSVLESITLDRF